MLVCAFTLTSDFLPANAYGLAQPTSWGLAQEQTGGIFSIVCLRYRRWCSIFPPGRQGNQKQNCSQPKLSLALIRAVGTGFCPPGFQGKGKSSDTLPQLFSHVFAEKRIFFFSPRLHLSPLLFTSQIHAAIYVLPSWLSPWNSC